jgi:hypothetical protein
MYISQCTDHPPLQYNCGITSFLSCLYLSTSFLSRTHSRPTQKPSRNSPAQAWHLPTCSTKAMARSLVSQTPTCLHMLGRLMSSLLQTSTAALGLKLVRIHVYVYARSVCMEPSAVCMLGRYFCHCKPVLQRLVWTIVRVTVESCDACMCKCTGAWACIEGCSFMRCPLQRTCKTCIHTNACIFLCTDS